MFLPRVSAVALLAASALFGADQALLSLVNPEAKAVGGMNVARTMSSPLGQFLLSQMNPNDKNFQDFVNTTGLDPRRDIRDVVFASSSNKPGVKNGGLVVARGVFNGPQLLAAAKTKGNASSQVYNGVEVVTHNGGALAVLDGSLLVAGDEANVKGAIDRRSNSALPAGEIFSKASTLMTRYDAWMASSMPPMSMPTPAPNQQMPAQALQGIIEASGGVTFDSVVSVDGEAVTRSDKDAQALMDVVKFMMSLMQMNGGNNPQFKQIEPILNSMEIRADANTVKFSLRVPEADLEKLINNRQAPRRRASR